MTHSFDAIILGGGAAGLMCAIEAGKRGRRVAVLEHNDSIGKKILISGGGRCNFTNIHCRPENFLSANPHFCKSALSRYAPADFIALVEKHGIKYHEKTLGQLFCDRSARDLLAMLEEECRTVGVAFFLNSHVREVSRTDQFVLQTSGAEFRAPAVAVATGGLSIPKLGATSFGYEIARKFDMKIQEPRPGLVPFILSSEDQGRYCDLAGVSAEVIASCNGQAFREKFLVTHRGLSGPAILQASSYWKRADEIEINLVPAADATAALRKANSQRTTTSLKSELRKVLPNRLADRWVELNPPTAWTNPALLDYEKHLHSWRLTPSDTEGFEKAEVTVGGIDTDELSAKTMESRKVPGLYFIGEVVDVTGHLGGFNFQWAWASGAAAGRAL